ncbi:hypothetical protein O3M35_006682 [Rhynocoris fuscipes]|uniref:Uncharacterized protein n=1 Tax=Rhynocoris fuscipes TaxID=488301 RepID=A0AAW1DJM2_9HEMI
MLAMSTLMMPAGAVPTAVAPPGTPGGGAPTAVKIEPAKYLLSHTTAPQAPQPQQPTPQQAANKAGRSLLIKKKENK